MRSLRYLLSRRAAVGGLAAAVWAAAVGPVHADNTDAEKVLGPVFSPSGPDAVRFGAAEGYPIADPTRKRQPGNPSDPKYRVGAYSHYDQIFATRRIERSRSPWGFRRTPVDIQYSYLGLRSSIPEYLSRNPVTGLLIAQDDRIYCEYYQYARTDRYRLISNSMAKTITGLCAAGAPPRP